MSILYESDDDFGVIDHPALLARIHETLQHARLFAVRTDGRLGVQASQVAYQVLAGGPGAGRAGAPLCARPQHGTARMVSMQMDATQQDAMRAEVRAIWRAIKQHLDETARTAGGTPADLFRAQTMPPTDLTFTPPGMAHEPSEVLRTFRANRRRLTFDRAAAAHGQPILTWHRLAITVHVPAEFSGALADALATHLATRLGLDRAAVEERVALARQGQVALLARVLEEETIGKLKTAAQMLYLRWLARTMQQTGHTECTLLERLIARLLAFQTYLRAPDRPDQEYEIAIGGRVYNLRALFGQADAFDDLPVYPIVHGALGETTDYEAGTRTFAFGLKLKLNGKVQLAGGITSFAYRLQQLRGSIPLDDGRLLHLAVLFAVTLAHFDDAAYDAVGTLACSILPALRAAGDQAEPQPPLLDVCGRVAAACEHAPVEALARSLRQVVHRAGDLAGARAALRVAVYDGLLEQDSTAVLEQGRLLRPVLERREYLRYIDVTARDVDQQVFFSMAANLEIEQVRAFEPKTRTAESCTIHYAADDLLALQVSLLVQGPETFSQGRAGAAGSAPRKGLAIVLHQPGTAWNEQDWFVYRYTVTLLSYLAIVALAATRPDEERRDLFVALLRAHRPRNEQSDDPWETYLAMLGKVLAFVLAHDHLAATQGLQRPHTMQLHVRRNAEMSLCGPLPKRFEFPAPLPGTPEALAILAVSSREADSKRLPEGEIRRRRVILLGSLTEISPVHDRAVLVRRLRTFADVVDAATAFDRPVSILDQVDWLYARGFRQILYVAQAPYSSLLHATQDRDSSPEGLFFVSREILYACTQGRPDLAIYPVFRTEYAAVRNRAPGANTLYVQDTRDLLRVMQDAGDNRRQLIVFLNLFSGIAGLTAQDRYHGVVSYATLLNVYREVLDEEQLRLALIDDRQGASRRKDALVQAITLYHLAHYERRRDEIAIKLDPYEEIIGDRSIGRTATGDGPARDLRFNFLAFLSEARKAIREGTRLV